MNLPAIRAKMGKWTYYVAVLTFDQINRYVKKVDEELHKSETLSDMIQRAITDNFVSIKNYLLTQEERFFNSLVLAVYEGDPKWIEVELDYQKEEFFNLGFLSLTGKEKIFPVDGQHRVEGIKAALKENGKLASEQVPVIFISHKNEQKERTRRLFSTLNRYAKPVALSEIIALDEDDINAIIVRDLVEEHRLFEGKKVINTKQKAIPDSNKTAFTSIITLYNCNDILLEKFIKDNHIKTNIKDFKRKRPEQEVIDSFKEQCFDFWNKFSSSTTVIDRFINSSAQEPAKKFRNKEDGGHLLFRPIGLLPFIKVVSGMSTRTGKSYEQVFRAFNKLNFNLNKKPWTQVLWNDYEKKMLRSDDILVELLLTYLFDNKLLDDDQLTELKTRYAAKLSYSEVDKVLDTLSI